MAADEVFQKLRARLIYDFREYLNIEKTSPDHFDVYDKRDGHVIKSVPFKVFDLTNLDDNYHHSGLVIENITVQQCSFMPELIENFFEENKNTALIKASNPPNHKESFDNQGLVFTRMVFLYTSKLSTQEEEIRSFFKSKGLKVVIRDEQYWQDYLKWKAHDAFICHDSNDKQFTDDLYHALLKRNSSTWLDKYSLKVGDSLSSKIDEGLRESKHAILLVSKNLLSNKKWARAEFQSLQTKQILSGDKKILLPIWLDVSVEEVKEYSLWLADKFGLDSKLGIESIADRLVEVFNKKDITPPPN